MESDGRRRLKTFHCMKCGTRLVEKTVTLPIEQLSETEKRMREGKPVKLTRQACPKEGCGWVFYNNPVPTVAAIVEYRTPKDAAKSSISSSSSSSPSSSTSSDPAVDSLNREILLVQGHGWPSSWFGLVTGFLEAHEDPAIGVLREVKEELGLDGRIERFIGIYPFERLNQLIVAYHVIVTSGEVVLQADELAAYKRVPLADLRPWSEGTGQAVRDFLIREFGESPPNSLTAFNPKNVYVDQETGKIVEIIQAKL